MKWEANASIANLSPIQLLCDDILNLVGEFLRHDATEGELIKFHRTIPDFVCRQYTTLCLSLTDPQAKPQDMIQ